ncbi:ABC transporter ATP-binding protein [Planosporangium mesophilum]|uniref:ABC transporter ATP-binding protein n=1 Tax=Planosporangium mesophilum TaxID=689768 RepID=A0A8J3TB53_9ACTN|nr:ABC transporter ATP-binding protein [Planosporangium mesophilum]NJC83994.1 ABC transporter ATP-binding protein [Planosporangium mesophilum]GII22637.1 ABC transporter ATP-binding protein [Planosporangium mesophilum]
MLSVRDLDVRYGEIRALRGVCMEVAQGEVVTLLGGNGAGKSTTLRAISGLLAPTGGDITFEGESIVGRRPEEIARMGIVHVPEGRQVIPGLSVLDNLRMGTSNGRMSRKDVPAGLERVFAVFPRLYDLRPRLGWSLSGGEQQMLVIGRAMMANPRLLMLDEPSLGLAPIVVREVFRIIGELHEAGLTVLLVEQNAYQALTVADRGYVVETGTVVVSGDARDLLDDDQMRSAYLGRTAAGGSSVTAAVPPRDVDGAS